MAFFSKADAKVRTFFELPKLFRKNFQKVFFWSGSSCFRSFVFQYFNHCRISLDCGCKGRAFPHSHQIHETLFCKYFTSFHLTRWFTKDAVKQIFKAETQAGKSHTLILFARTYRVKKTRANSYKVDKWPLQFHRINANIPPNTHIPRTKRIEQQKKR